MADRWYVAAALALVVAVGSAPALAADSDALHMSAEGSGVALELYDPLLDDFEDEVRQEKLDRDPFERANRWSFAFNQQLDRWLLDPITKGYQWVVPGPGRRAVNRVFANLNSPVIFANELLQLRPVPAATTLTRFVVNSSFGVAGIFDVAEEVMHLPRGEADFGQTLARYWVPRGPYLVVPIFGPSTARDAFGTVVDQALDPLTYIVGPANLQWQLILGGSQGLSLRDENLDELHALRDSSVDFYSALRSAYLQNRRARELEAHGEPATVEEPPAELPLAEAAPVEELLAEPPLIEELLAEPPLIEEPRVESPLPEEPFAEDPAAPAPALDQDSVPEASFSMRSSIAAMSASKSSRFTMPENSDLRSASSLTVPSR